MNIRNLFVVESTRGLQQPPYVCDRAWTSSVHDAQGGMEQQNLSDAKSRVSISPV